MSALENPTPKNTGSDIPAQEAGIFLENQPPALARPALLGLVVVGESVPPLSDIENPIEAVRNVGRQSRKYGELVINASAGGHTTMHATEEAWDKHVEQESKRVEAELKAIYDPPAASPSGD